VAASSEAGSGKQHRRRQSNQYHGGNGEMRHQRHGVNINRRHGEIRAISKYMAGAAKASRGVRKSQRKEKKSASMAK